MDDPHKASEEKLGEAARCRAFNKIAFLQSETEYLLDLLRRHKVKDAMHVAKQLSRGFTNVATRLGAAPPSRGHPLPAADACTVIYTDGTTRFGIVAGAIVVRFKGGSTERTRVFKGATANDHEVVAILMALEYVRECDPEMPVVIVTDSTDAVGCTFGWSDSESTEHRKQLRTIYVEEPFAIRLIEPHERRYNDQAHRLCRQAAKQQALLNELTKAREAGTA